MVADLGLMHVSNPAWPPHARFHALWSVLHVVATHALALGLLGFGERRTQMLRVRMATLLFLSYVVSFFVAWLLASPFGATLTPDVPVARRPPVPFGLDGNLLSFLVVAPVVFLAWRLCERGGGRQDAV
jgi:hypothetical protein